MKVVGGCLICMCAIINNDATQSPGRLYPIKEKKAVFSSYAINKLIVYGEKAEKKVEYACVVSGHLKRICSTNKTEQLNHRLAVFQMGRPKL